MPHVITSPYRQIPICPGHSVGSPTEGTFATCSTDGPQEMAPGMSSDAPFFGKFTTALDAQVIPHDMSSDTPVVGKFTGSGEVHSIPHGMENDAGNSSPLGTP